MLQLLIELLAEPRQLVGVAQVLGVHLFVVLACVGAIDCLVVRVRAFAPGLGAAGTVVALGHGGVFLGVGAIVVGGLALHFLGLGAEHGFLFRFRFAVAVLGIVLRTGLFAAVVAVLGIVVRFGIDLGFRQVERRQQLSRRAGEGCLVVLSVGHLRQRLVGGVAQGVTPQVQHAPCALRRRLSRRCARGPAAPAPCRSATDPCASCGRSLRTRTPPTTWRADWHSRRS